MMSNSRLLTVSIMLLLSSTTQSANSETETNKASYSKANVLLDKFKNKEALKLLNEIIQKDPTNAEAYASRCKAYAQLGELDKSLADGNKSIALNPKLPLAYLNRSGVFDLKNRVNNAMTDCDKAILLDSKSELAYLVRTYLFLKQNNYQKAIEDCNKAIDLNPKSAKAYSFKGNAYHHLKQDEEALFNLGTAIELGSPQIKSQALLERGHILFHQKKFQDAIKDYDEAIRINIQPLSAHKMRSDVFREIGDYPKHIEDLSVALKIKPKNLNDIESRANAHLKIGEIRQAIDDFNTEISIDQSHKHVLTEIAAAYDEVGVPLRAAQFRTKYLKREPKDFYEYLKRANNYDALGKFDLAREDRFKACKLSNETEIKPYSLCYPLIDFKNLFVDPVEKVIDKQMKNNSIILPLRYAHDGYKKGHFGIPVKINGHTLTLMIDTGCGHSDIWNSSCSKIGVVNSSKLKSNYANGKAYTFGFFRAKEFQIGNLVLNNVGFGINEGLPGHPVFGGFLGGNIMEKFAVTIDFANSNAIFAPSFSLAPGHSYIILPMRMHNHRPYCNITLDGKLTRSALLDTGCPFSMAPDSLVRPLIKRKLNFNDRIQGPWLGLLSSEKVQLQTVALGKRFFKAPAFDVFPSHEAPKAAADIIIGNDFLSNFKTVTFDYYGKRVIFEPKD